MSEEIKSPLYVRWSEKKREMEAEIGKIKGEEEPLKKAWELEEDIALATIIFLICY